MAATIYYEKDAPIGPLQGKKVAVVGYGSQGHAHSQNLRDSGIEVAVAELEGTDNFKLATEHGFTPGDIKTALDGAALIISQFTLYADVRKGRRPGFTDAALPEVAEPLVEHFTQAMRGHGVPVKTGVFGAHMMVEIHNDGPVTILVEK